MSRANEDLEDENRVLKENVDEVKTDIELIKKELES